MKAFILALIIALSAPVPEKETTAEYMLITDIQQYSEDIDVITVCNAEGDESQFFADTHTYIGGDFCKVTMNKDGWIIAVE